MKELELQKHIIEELTQRYGDTMMIIRPEKAWWYQGKYKSEKGVSDLILIYKGRSIYVELKVDNNTTSIQQDKFLDGVGKLGCVCGVARSLNDILFLLDPEERKRQYQQRYGKEYYKKNRAKIIEKARQRYYQNKKEVFKHAYCNT